MSRGGRARRWATPLLLGLLCVVVYNANGRTIGAGDTYPARYLPLILWQDGTLDLTANARLVAHGHPSRAALGDAGPPPVAEGGVPFAPDTYWTIRTREGRLGSLYPIVAPLLVAPLYLPGHLWLNAHGRSQPHLDRVAEMMEKLSASLLAALACVLMFVLLRREGHRWALPLTLAFAFGTNTWMISSQALWQHGSGEVLVLLGMLLALARPTPRRLALLGLVCVLMAANRPPDALTAGALLAFAVWRRPGDVRWLALGGVLPLVALLAYNLGFIGNLVGGYAGKEHGGRNFLHADPLGPAGLLISPTRGLFVFTPFLVFVGVGLRQRLRDPRTRRAAILLGTAATAQLLFVSQTDWRAGVSWGPRWLTDLLPILVWMLAPAPAVLRPTARRVLVAAMVAAVAVQAIGAFWYEKVSDERIFAGGTSMRAAWNPANTPFVYELRHRPAHAELTCGARATVERVGTPLPAPPAQLDDGAAIEGWAVACGRTPAQVLALVDGAVVGATEAFTDRPDVNRSLGVTGPTGWHVDADTRGLGAGPHTLQVALRVAPRSDIRIVRELPVVVPPRPAVDGSDLPASATVAARRVLLHQAGAGYWLTSYTEQPRFTGPQLEMNTYLTATLIDLLAPDAAATGLQPVVDRAREHLAAQIEDSGLVRYHGLPDGPTIGTLGCAITPDADDTALAWRITGKDRSDPRAGPMLRTLARYRDPAGRYRTWLAPQADYQCLDPGSDPDPADLVNQMHVYLMLRTLAPPAARKLCAAIRRTGDEKLVYYAKAPLVHYLRSAQLRRLGCRVPLPEGGLARAAPGQEPWAELVRLLVHPERARRSAGPLLTRLARDDFALLRRTPPLLYHNDLTATVPRYYWSEDAGYALWLRLYALSRGAP